MQTHYNTHTRTLPHTFTHTHTPCCTGLLELFYGVYEKDPDRCLDALVDMGVLVPSADRQAVRRTAEFFLASFQDRLKAQKEVCGGLGGVLTGF